MGNKRTVNFFFFLLICINKCYIMFFKNVMLDSINRNVIYLITLINRIELWFNYMIAILCG